MTAAEQTRTVTLLALAVHDLLSDARVTEGLIVTARPTGGGRVTTAYGTLSGAYAFAGLPGMRDAEHGEDGVARDFDVQVTDTRGRYLPTVLQVRVPLSGLMTQDDAGLPGSSLPAGLPVYLFSAPARPLPAHIAAVRAHLATEDDAPAAYARLSVVTDPGTELERRSSGIADNTGAVVVALPYPRFGPVSPESVPAGTRGEPTAQRTWPLSIRVHHEPNALEHPTGLTTPTLASILSQGAGTLRTSTDDSPRRTLEDDLTYGADLVLRTTGDPNARLIVGAAA